MKYDSFTEEILCQWFSCLKSIWDVEVKETLKYYDIKEKPHQIENYHDICIKPFFVRPHSENKKWCYQQHRQDPRWNIILNKEKNHYDQFSNLNEQESIPFNPVSQMKSSMKFIVKLELRWKHVLSEFLWIFFNFWIKNEVKDIEICHEIQKVKVCENYSYNFLLACKS